jgi:hypothetical protein
MSQELKSLGERLYDDFYTGFEIDREKNGKLSKMMSKLGKYVRYVCGAGAVGLGSYLTYKLTNGDVSLGEFIFEGGLTAATTGLTVHMHDVKKIFEAMYKKNTGENLDEEEIAEVKRAGKVGRYAHFGAATAMLGSCGALMVSNPLFLIVAPILPFWYYYTINKGYGALYSSAVDYTVGERRQFRADSK